MISERTIGFVTAGGTCDKRYSTDAKTRNYSFGEPALTEALKRMRYAGHPIQEAIDHVIHLEPMDGLDMRTSDCMRVAEECDAMKKQAVVVTIGTDGAIKTAQHIAMMEPEKTIVLTGSSLPASDSNSDFWTNVAAAVAYAHVLPPGVYVAVHGQAHAWNKCTKRSDGKFVSCPRIEHQELLSEMA